MIKTYVSALLVALLAVQMAHARESMANVFALLDAADKADGQPTTPTSSASDAAPAEQAPGNEESDTLSWLLEKGKEQYKVGNYDEAIMMFDGVLAIDKYNKDAVAYRHRTAKRIAAKEAKKQGASRAQALADIDAAWNPEPKALADSGIPVDVAEAMDPDQQAIEQVVGRLRAINVSVLDFADTRIEEVVRFFAETSRNQGGEDVDILLVGMESASGNNVTISVSDMSLYEALQYVVEMAALRFEVKPGLVVVMPASYVPVAAMVAKSYDIIPEVGADLESVADSGGGAEDLFGDSSSVETATGPVDVASFFSVVDFPEGSSAIYQPRFKKLFVKNTPKGLKAVEAILVGLEGEAIKQRSQQVEIEAKFVEFSEGALEELGFDWNVYGSGSAAGMELDNRGVITDPDNAELEDFQQLRRLRYVAWDAQGAGQRHGWYSDWLFDQEVDYYDNRFIDPVSGQRIYDDGTGRPGQNVFGSAQRNNTEGFESIQSGLLGLMGGSPATMVLGNRDIDLQISAMEQEGTADILMAPRVVTKSGSEALIRVAETHRYPQDYDAETGQHTVPIVKPQDWEDVDLGVSLKVIPVVDADSGTIDLELHPQIMELGEPDVYVVGVSARFGYVSGNQVVPLGTGENLNAIMPSFERRSVQTQVTIADGHTVALGGLVNERTETFRDQVPILGDIPYLGRLFRTEGSRSAKKNLTIFVKATIVDPFGTTDEERELARR